MNVKHIFLSALVLALGGVGAVRGEDPPGAWSGMAGSTTLGAPPAGAPAPGEAAPVPGSPSAPGMLSSWIAYVQPGCCGPVGGDGPIGSELFFRGGPSMRAGGGIYDHALTTGWDLEGGGRVLFFNTDRDADWAVSLSLSNISNHGQHSDIIVPLKNIIVQIPPASPGQQPTPQVIPTALVTIRSLNRTFVNGGLGRDWYLIGSAYPCKCVPSWRFGIDGGGRYGSAKGEFHEIHHRTDTIAGLFAALHTEVEIPCGCAILSAGFRVEWDYTWMDILQIQNNSDIADLNALATFGVRW
jgi:hypothetical protein